MRCRKIKDENDKKFVVWFGSYGKNILAEKQIINLKEIQDISNTIKSQTYNINFTNINSPTTIILYGENDEVLDSYTATSNNSYALKGTLNKPLIRVDLTTSDFEDITLILNKYSTSKKENNFSVEKDAVVDSLIERLSILKGELWYKASYGQPIMSITKSKVAMDSFIAEVIMSHPDVKQIDSFDSYIKDKKYYCYTVINTKYGEIELSI